jgi:branched-chain amino acid transport system substrate-binding protein
VSINRKKLAALLGVLAIGIAVASTAGAASQGTKGATASTIKIGATFPLTGSASLYATIAGAEQAYYGYVDAHGGVNHHMIDPIIEDDQYNPATTVTDVKDLVENKHVFAIVGSLGTAPGLATMNYLNSKGVPQVLLATGDAYWGLCSETGKAFHKIPGVCAHTEKWTEGWQPDYPGEARIYAKYILAHQPSGHAKIGVLYQNDAYGQNYLAGLVAGLGSHKGDIVKKQPYTFGDSSSAIFADILALKTAGANTVVIFATPAAAIAALGSITGLSWSPLTLLNNVSANRVFMLTAEGHGANPAGVISSTYIKSQSVTPSDSAMQLGKAIIYATGNAGLKHEWDIGDSNLVYGLAVAWTFCDALKHAGANPTRASLMHALRNLKESGKNKNPFVYPGMYVKTSSTQTFPMQQLQLEKWNGTTHDWKTFAGIYKSGS